MCGASANLKDKINENDENKSLNCDSFDSEKLPRGEEIFKEILKLRETLSVRESESKIEKPDISFKQKLRQIFKPRFYLHKIKSKRYL